MQMEWHPVCQALYLTPALFQGRGSREGGREVVAGVVGGRWRAEGLYAAIVSTHCVDVIVYGNAVSVDIVIVNSAQSSSKQIMCAYTRTVYMM